MFYVWLAKSERKDEIMKNMRKIDIIDAHEIYERKEEPLYKF